MKASNVNTLQYIAGTGAVGVLCGFLMITPCLIYTHFADVHTGIPMASALALAALDIMFRVGGAPVGALYSND